MYSKYVKGNLFGMKEISFRPLRRIKKTGKICVASYMAWRKVKTADYNEFLLMVEQSYKSMPKDEFVYNHNGEQLFWFNHREPEKLPLQYADVDLLNEKIGEYFLEKWQFTEPMGEGFHHSVRGFDCDGVPVFSHNTADSIANSYEDMSQFEPLTVEVVVIWIGWFLYKLNNSKLQP